MAFPLVRDIPDLPALNKLAHELLNLGFRHFALKGDLGAGKTAFTQQAGAVLGLSALMPSPTFTILAIYPVSQTSLYHFDLYRLPDPEEAFDAGLSECMDDPYAYVFIEWPEVVEAYLPQDYICLSFAYIDSSARRVTVSLPAT